MAKKYNTDLAKKDSIHKVWKYISRKILIKSGGFGMQGINIMDLTNRDSISYILEGSKEKTPPIPYQIVDNSIVFQNQDPDTQMKFKISELTDHELKIILHAIYKNKNGEKVDAEILEMTFEAEN